MYDNNLNNKKNNNNNKFFGRFPASIIALSLVSFLMNLSTSIVSSTATNFVGEILKCDVSFIVRIRSFAEGFSYFLKAFIGVFSDISKKRKLFLIIGYGGVLIIKPLFVLVTLGLFSPVLNSSIYGIAQIFDRLLNAVRDTPRDSLIVDASPIHLRAQSFSLRRSFASFGSLLGGILTLLTTYIFINYSVLYTIAAIPAIYSVYVLFKNVQEPNKTQAEEKENWFSIRDLLNHKKSLLKYILFMGIIFIMSFGKFNEFCMFQIARDLGYSNKFSIGLYTYYYTIVAIASYVLSLAKKKDNILLLIFSMLSLIVTNFIIGSYNNIFVLLLATLFSGVYVGITESLICGAIIEIFPTKNMRATLLGIMNTILGISICLVGWIVSILSKTISLQSIYLYGTIPPIIGIFLFMLFYHKIYLEENIKL
jgi:hypothetical protein